MTEQEALENICFGGLMRKIIPSEVEMSLIKQGHIRKGVGGLMPTRQGYEFIKDQK